MPKGTYNHIKPVWNKGLTKETDKRIKKQSDNVKKNKEVIEKRRIFFYKVGKSRKGKTSHRKGVKLTDEQKKKCGIKPKDWSERMKQMYINHPELREKRKNCVPSKRLSKNEYEKVKAKIRDTVNNNYKTKPEIKENIRKKRLLQVFPVNDTKIEKLLQTELLKRNIKFITHKAIEICQPDIFLPDYNTIIFADGCYWHGCPTHFPKYNPNVQWDKGCTEYLKKCGYKVFRFWEHEINKSPKKCIDKVIE